MDIHFFVILAATFFSSVSSLLRITSAQTESIGTSTVSASSVAGSVGWGVLPTLMLMGGCAFGMTAFLFNLRRRRKRKLDPKRNRKLRGRKGMWDDRQPLKTSSQPQPKPIKSKVPKRTPETTPIKTPSQPPIKRVPGPKKPDKPREKAIKNNAPRLNARAFGADALDLLGDKPTLANIEKWAAKYNKGTIDARSAVPWDLYEYPETPPVPQDALARYKRSKWWMEMLGWAKDNFDIKDWLKRPAPPQEPLPPGRQLPSLLAASDVNTQADVLDIKGASIDELSKKTKTGWGRAPLDQLDAYLKEAGIRHFKAHELCRHNWHKMRKKTGPNKYKRLPSSFKPVLEGASSWAGDLEAIGPDDKMIFVLPRYVVPSPELWPNIVGALRVLDRFREWLGQPVSGVSGYRFPAYNKGIQGSHNSFHMDFKAVDFRYSKFTQQGEMDVRIFWRFLKALYRKRGSGVGAYPQFCHLDLDVPRYDYKGKAVRWVHRARKIKNNVFGKGVSYRLVGKK